MGRLWAAAVAASVSFLCSPSGLGAGCGLWLASPGSPSESQRQRLWRTFSSLCDTACVVSPAEADKPGIVFTSLIYITENPKKIGKKKKEISTYFIYRTGVWLRGLHVTVHVLFYSIKNNVLQSEATLCLKYIRKSSFVKTAGKNLPVGLV